MNTPGCLQAGLGVLVALLALDPGERAAAQGITIPEIPSETVPVFVDSGLVENTGKEPAVIFAAPVIVPGATWLRLQLGEVLLAGSAEKGTASYLQITSVTDGAVQHLNAAHVRQWQDRSAFFNGDEVILELIAHPMTGPNRVVVTGVQAGVGAAGEPETLCGPTDSRLPSDDPRVGRWWDGSVLSACTASIIDDANHCLVSAGHCVGAGRGFVMEFNVPLSDPVTGERRHPPPEDQYAIDPASLQLEFNGRPMNNDWAYFGCFPNSNTGLTPVEAQGAFLTVASQPTPILGQQIRMTGYGGRGSGGAPPEWNQIQRTHAGEYVSSGTVLQYRVDTTAGNSGSPLIDEQSGEMIGIHTTIGCTATGGANRGTPIDNSGLRRALANPSGVCVPTRLGFSYPGGRPVVVTPAGGSTVDVIVEPSAGLVPQPGTGLFHYDVGAGVVSLPMTQTSPNEYRATFPAAPCDTRIRYSFSAEDSAGNEFFDPPGGPQSAFLTIAASDFRTMVALEESFEAGLPAGWSATGLWHATSACAPTPPCGGTMFAYYGQDGVCHYQTGARTQGGLLSPPVTIPSVSPHGRVTLSFCAILVTENRFGWDWANVRVGGVEIGVVRKTDAWETQWVDLTRFAGTTIQIEFYFDTFDRSVNTLLGWLLDQVRIAATTPVCAGRCVGDLDGDGDTDLADLGILLGDFGCTTPPGPCVGDLNGDGDTDLTDLGILLADFGCAP